MEFRRATSEDQVIDRLAKHGDSVRLIAGGTDVMLQYLRGDLRPAEFLHIESIRPLARVSNRGPSRLGALVTHRRLATDQHVRARHPALAEAASTVGGWQTQAVGTLAGNICNASPAADTAAPLLVADAIVELRSKQGVRRVPLQEFFVGRRSVDRRPDELVTAIEAEPVRPSDSEVYLKVGRRGAMVVAVVGLALRLGFADDGQVNDARLALCSVAPTPIRALRAERVIAEGRASTDAVREAGEILLDEISPIDDARSSSMYRRMVVAGLLERATCCCRSRFAAKRGLDSASLYDCQRPAAAHRRRR